MATIIDSMAPLCATAGTDIIVQGDTNATEFYVLECGKAEVYVQKTEWGASRKVLTYNSGRCVCERCIHNSTMSELTRPAKLCTPANNAR